MNPSRFEALISAYGAEPARWPAAERETALAFASAHPDAGAMAEAERALDDALDAWKPQFPTMALRNAILAASPPFRRRVGWNWGPNWRAVWLSGAGLAAACAAGALVGATLIGPSLADAFPSDRSAAGGALSDGVSLFGSPLDVDLGG